MDELQWKVTDMPKEDEKKSDITRKEKIGFFIVNVGNIPIMTMMNMYLLYYYVTVIGLDPVAIGTLFLIARLLDAINDPLMGYVIDHLPKTKLGRFRSYIIIGSIICGLNYLVLWLGPGLLPTGKLIIAFITYLLFGFTFDLMDIPLNSMIPVMSGRDRDRTLLSSIKGLGYLFGLGIFLLLPVPFLNLFSSEQEGFYVLIILTVTMIISFSVIGALLIKERVQPLTEEKYKIKDSIKILGARPVLSFFLESITEGIGGGMFTALLFFFFVFVIQKEELFIVYTAFSGIGVLIGVFLLPRLIEKFGKKTTKIIANGISLLAFFLIFFIPRTNIALVLIMFGFSAIGMGINGLLSYGIQADNMDYIEWKFGFRAEAAVASINSFIVKGAGGIGASIAAYALAIIKFNADLPAQTEATIQGLYYIIFGIPSLLYFIGFLIWAFLYPLNRDTRQIMLNELQDLRRDQLDKKDLSESILNQTREK